MKTTLPQAFSIDINATYTVSQAQFDKLPELPEGIRPDVLVDFEAGTQTYVTLNGEQVTFWTDGEDRLDSYENDKWSNGNGKEPGPGPWDSFLTQDQVYDVLAWGRAVHERVDAMAYGLLTAAATSTNFLAAAAAFATEDATAFGAIAGARGHD